MIVAYVHAVVLVNHGAGETCQVYGNVHVNVFVGATSRRPCPLRPPMGWDAGCVDGCVRGGETPPLRVMGLRDYSFQNLLRSITPHHLLRHHLRGDLLDQVTAGACGNRNLPCV
jgi:hypothetical protein